MTPGTHQAWQPLTLLVGSIFALSWAALSTSPPRQAYNTSDSVSAGSYRTLPANSLAPGDLMLVTYHNGCAARPPAGDRTVVEDFGGDGNAALVHAR